jgi:two-component system, response regulator RegA
MGLALSRAVLTQRIPVTRIVFIVDRDPANQEMLARTFRARGWLAYPVGGCMQAMTAATAHAPELLVIDQRLAHDGGVTLLSRLRKANPAVRSVVVSPAPSISAAVRAIRAGFDDYVATPIVPQKLMEILEGAAPEAPPVLVDHAIGPASRRLPSLFEVEWEHIHTVLYDCRGNITRAARTLGLDRRSLQRKLRRQPPTPTFAANEYR